VVESPAVLIVEDEPVVLKVAGLALASRDIWFVEATNAADAAQKIRGTPFKVVLTDLKLPGESGLDLLRWIRQLDEPPEVVMITGYATTENALLSFELGAFDFVPKPFDVDELASVTERALRYTERPRSAHAGPDERYSLGRHSWARLEPDGVATFGVEETMSGVAGDLVSIDCLAAGSEVVQGKSFCTLRSADGLDHRVRAPLSGQIALVNPALVEDPTLIDRDPFATGWLARVVPVDLEQELSHLSQPQREVPG
jgi:CheY-like chemotaxis protein